jgi:hypothetical protein
VDVGGRRLIWPSGQEDLAARRFRRHRSGPILCRSDREGNAVFRKIFITGLIAGAGLGLGAGVAAADVPHHGNDRDLAAAACSGDDDNVLVDDEGADGSTSCMQGGILTSCDATECVIITDDPRLSHRTNGSGARTAHTMP